jgi:hypothetical protein
MGACCGCPLETRLTAPGVQRIGRVVEDFDPYCGKCCESTCCCVFYAKARLPRMCLQPAHLPQMMFLHYGGHDTRTATV